MALLWLNVQTFFISVATILGTGILGLPVKMSLSGFVPFVASFTLCLLMQLGCVLLFVEVLQRLRRHLVAGGAPVADAHVDLHTMGVVFLSPLARHGFNGAVMLHFVTILISYSLAGASAYAQLIGVRMAYCIAPFVICYTTVIIAAARVIQPVISVATLFKCALLVTMIATVGFVAAQHAVTPLSRWSAVMEPFLIGTVALGGVVNVMPVIFARVPDTARAVAGFRTSVCAGVLVCWALNVVWGYFLLSIVPQRAADSLDGVSLERAAAEGSIVTVPLIDIINRSHPEYRWIATAVSTFIMVSITVSFVTVGTGLRHYLDGVVRHMLEDTAHRGSGRGNERWDVAAVEVPEGSLQGEGPKPGASAAVSASLATAGSPAASWRDTAPLTARGAPPRRADTVRRSLRQRPWLLSAAVFALILAVAQLNPTAFIVVLEVFTSFAMNLESGAFVALMFIGARRGAATVAPANTPLVVAAGGAASAEHRRAPTEVALPLGAAGRPVMLFTFGSFMLAVAYDVVHASVGVFGGTVAAWLLVGAGVVGAVWVITVLLFPGATAQLRHIEVPGRPCVFTWVPPAVWAALHAYVLRVVVLPISAVAGTTLGIALGAAVDGCTRVVALSAIAAIAFFVHIATVVVRFGLRRPQLALAGDATGAALHIVLAAAACGGGGTALFMVACLLCATVACVNGTICERTLVVRGVEGADGGPPAPTKEFELLRI